MRTLIALFAALALASFARSEFIIVPLGVTGGIDESSLTSFAAAHSSHPKDMLLLDAGSVFSGIQRSLDAQGSQLGALVEQPDQNVNKAYSFLRNNIKAIAVTHPHLDHLGGAVVASADMFTFAPTEKPKPLLGLAHTIDAVRDHVFNGILWPNFGNEGNGAMKKLEYARLTPGTEVPLSSSLPHMSVTAYPVTHGMMMSTAFLVKSADEYILFFGDVGPDEVQNVKTNAAVWDAVADLVAARKLAGIMIESAYTSARGDKQLFGHLTPKWIATELGVLASKVTAKNKAVKPLEGLNVMIIHIKTTQANESPRAQILHETKEATAALGVNVILPEHGQAIRLSPAGANNNSQNQKQKSKLPQKLQKKFLF